MKLQCTMCRAYTMFSRRDQNIFSKQKTKKCCLSDKIYSHRNQISWWVCDVDKVRQLTVYRPCLADDTKTYPLNKFNLRFFNRNDPALVLSEQSNCIDWINLVI